MFRKLVSNLAFSPALVGQLGFYAKRLRKEESVRRLGLIFIAFALVVQFFAVFQAPEPATAADATDMVYNSVWSKQALLNTYDNYVNKGHIARAAEEATAFQTREVLEAMNRNSASAAVGGGLTELKVDSGMTRDELLMQFQADQLGVHQGLSSI